MRSPEVLPFGLESRYFFFAALVAAFFAGAFLAAFLVAICLFSLMTIFSVVAAIDIAVEECIDSCLTSVKKKTQQAWKNRQHFFERGIECRLHSNGRSVS